MSNFNRSNYTYIQLGSKLLELYDSGELPIIATASIEEDYDGFSSVDEAKFIDYMQEEFLKIHE